MRGSDVARKENSRAGSDPYFPMWTGEVHGHRRMARQRNLAGVEFAAYAGELVGMQSKDALQRAHEVLDYVGLGEARYRRVET